MKAGQALSLLGEHLFPPEVNAVLKKLQKDSPPLAWIEIEKVIIAELGADKIEFLEIEKTALGTASLGQVHKARDKRTGEIYCLKIQYPGVAKAIDSDLKALKSIFTFINIIPKGPSYEQLFEEVKEMLHQEVDYVHEAKSTEEFRILLEGDTRFVVPRVIHEFSTGTILTTTFEEGISVDSLEVKNISLERRNGLAKNFMDLYFSEFYRWGMVQSDPHFGNYRIRLGDRDQLVLLDFGAVRRFSKTFQGNYTEMVRGTFLKDRPRTIAALRLMNFVEERDDPKLLILFCEVCELIMEPFYGVEYDWGKTDLGKRVMLGSKDLALKFRFRAPPREIVFLDRKLLGVYIFLSVLDVKFDPAPLLEKYIFAEAKQRLGSL
jgi:predicted unusual protein kinase regulating ubiquinone biosynthesis (AarF/ABC1/UbiB family)